MVTIEQRVARAAFNLDAAMAALPPLPPEDTLSASHKGQAGFRLRSHLVADISDPALRGFAQETLGAVRCSEQYLDALRVVLGNQAEAERCRYVLEMNLRVTFAPERVMRTIIDQMRAAGVSFGSVVGFGNGRCQLVQCFVSRKRHSGLTPSEELRQLDRRTEAANDARLNGAVSEGRFVPISYPAINAAGIPY